jgi:hypothetical protein
MNKLDKTFVERRIDLILRLSKQSTPPVNLGVLAEIQKVRHIECRPMLLEGCIDVTEGGFKIFIKGDFSKSWEVSENFNIKTLSRRQRFTLAHEITHTFFYDISTNPPKVSKLAPKKQVIEELCQDGARKILLPERFLISRLEKAGYLSFELTLEILKDFKASPEVIIRRIDQMHKFKTPGRAIIFAKMDRIRQDAQIRAAYFHTASFNSIGLCKPKLFTTLKEWESNFFQDDFWEAENWDSIVKINGANIIIKKKPYFSQKRFFFIEMEILY